MDSNNIRRSAISGAVLLLAAASWGCNSASNEQGPATETATETATDAAGVAVGSPTPEPAPAPAQPVDPDAPVHCPAVEEPLPPAECAALTQVQTGSGALKTPPQMTVGQPEVVTLALSRAAGSSAPSEALAGAPGVERPLAPAVGRWMEATIIAGPGLKATISPQTPELQDLFASEDAFWQWTVEATEPGARQLTLRTRVMVKGADGEFRPRGRGFTRQYPIDVRVSQREGVIRDIEQAGKDAGRIAETGDGWEKFFYALAALVVAIGAVWAAIRGFGKAKAGDKSDSQDD